MLTAPKWCYTFESAGGLKKNLDAQVVANQLNLSVGGGTQVSAFSKIPR